jgi:hypothetical protein
MEQKTEDKIVDIVGTKILGTVFAAAFIIGCLLVFSYGVHVALS